MEQFWWDDSADELLERDSDPDEAADAGRLEAEREERRVRGDPLGSVPWSDDT